MDHDFDTEEYLEFLLKYCDTVQDDAFERVSGARQVADHLKMLELRADSRVLEVGCGTGRVLEIMYQAFGVTADGCDVSSYAINHLKKSRPRFADRVSVLDAHGLEVFPNRAYDAAVYWGVFELTPQRAQLAELSRIIAPCGQVFISSVKHPAPFPDDEDAQAALAAYEAKKIPLYLTDPEPFEAALKGFGFEISQRIVFERKKHVVEDVYDVDRGGPRTFSEAFYLLRKTNDVAVGASFNHTFGRGPAATGYD